MWGPRRSEAIMTDSTWTPPENPDPSEILNSARIDARRGRYEQALSKHIWLHDNAFKYQRSQYGVRLSFALSYWIELARVYPPAKVAFLLTRDDTENAFRENHDFHLFHDLSSMNRDLDEENRTVELFLEAADKDQELGQRLYHLAEPYLISAGLYRECGPFLEFEHRLEMAKGGYQIELQVEERYRSVPSQRHARIHYVNQVATLVALLVLNERETDARTACETALEVIDDDDFRAILDAAMTGQFPS